MQNISNQYGQAKGSECMPSFPSFHSYKSFDSESSGKSPQALSPISPNEHSTSHNTWENNKAFSFKIMQRTKTRQFSDFGDPIDLQQSLNLGVEYDKTKYKCYKCFQNGKNKGNFYKNKCRQCHGTEFITKKHPMIKIMQEILDKKIPNSSPKSSSSHHDLPNLPQNFLKKQTLLHVSIKDMPKDMIRQESFSYQEQQLIICKICRKECQTTTYRFCQKCYDYIICEHCFSKDTYMHEHYLIIKESKLFDRHNLSRISYIPNMKKISEHFNSQSSREEGEREDSFIETKCSHCSNGITLYYQKCLFCQNMGIEYILCTKCSLNKRNIHDIFHRFQKKSLDIKGQDIQHKNNVELRVHSVRDESNKDNVLKDLSMNEFDFSQSYGNTPRINDNNHSDSNNLQEATQSFLDLMEKSNNQGLQGFQYDYNQQEANSLHFKSHSSSSFQGELRVINDQELNFMVSPISDRRQKSQERMFSLQNQKDFITNHHQDSNDPEKKEEDYIFHDYCCDICHIEPIRKKRYHCTVCEDYDLCQVCFVNKRGEHFHDGFVQIGREQLVNMRNSVIELTMSKRFNHSLMASRTLSKLIPQKQLK